MGTRSLTFVYENNRPLINMYRQFDGYVSGHGRELSDFLSPITVGNGIRGDGNNFANGMGCLAAQMIANFKQTAGGFYIHSVQDTDCGQDYEYHVHDDRIIVKSYNGRQIFSGTWAEFDEFVKQEEIA